MELFDFTSIQNIQQLYFAFYKSGDTKLSDQLPSVQACSILVLTALAATRRMLLGPALRQKICRWKEMGTRGEAKKCSATGLRSGIKGTTMFRCRNLDSVNSRFRGFGRCKCQRTFTLVGRLCLNLIVSVQQCGLSIWSAAVQLEGNIILNIFWSGSIGKWARAVHA
ncbi:hypothetical protein SS50377_28546 [Spironucleus salmonicida]|uniref:Uncharacterized protein n=1 Tax=Spironucleus salmonicida TaxID=348837 RepID=V6LBJ5_9EUKA|nr:hypothetical protein SS50377_28546 [Spironucleus salmonicida]|eukprot:EST41623.1 Hypothetical protein SS50377_18976 [Spironucleus salmonicida]